MSYSTKPMLLALITTFLFSSLSFAQDIDPRGIYFIAPFVLFLTSGVYFCEADINIDGAVDFFDIAPFIDLLSAGN